MSFSAVRPRQASSKVGTLSETLNVLKRAREQKKKIVFTNGCFDILHLGHIRTLEKARSLGDLLVVAVNRDSSVKNIKGPVRPLNGENERTEVLAALECVDRVLLFSEKTPEALIRKIRPEVLVKGGDWKIKDIVGGSFVKSYGGKVLSIKFVKGFSTTRLIEKIKKNNAG